MVQAGDVVATVEVLDLVEDFAVVDEEFLRAEARVVDDIEESPVDCYD